MTTQERDRYRRMQIQYDKLYRLATSVVVAHSPEGRAQDTPEILALRLALLQDLEASL